jgi:hypothetical protein
MPQTEKSSESILDQIIERYGDDLDLYILQGFNNSIIGIDENSGRIIYSTAKIIEEIIEESKNSAELTHEEAFEHFAYTIQGNSCGDKTPILCYDIF